ncbi:hypothetical protein E4U41_004881 [Claviceps citrina]|nr:hypothetical protein E4U41_004881 [Claviceps citrina]
MPHLVSNFLRCSSGNVAHLRKSAIISRSSRTSSRNNSASASPDASDSEDHHVHRKHGHEHEHEHHEHEHEHEHEHGQHQDQDHDRRHHPVRMPEPGGDAAHKKHHRLSLPFGRSSRQHHPGDGHGRGRSESSHAAGLTLAGHASSSSPASLSWSIESPPVVLYGAPGESTGALISGLMYMHVQEEALQVDGFVATLSMHTRYKKPFHGHCAGCQTRVAELKTWRFLGQPTSLRRGTHQFPFSALLAGDLAASVNAPLVCISYVFRAEAVVAARRPAAPSSSSTSVSSSAPFLPLRFERTLDVKRSLPEPPCPHHSVRVFPPTNIKASAHYASVIHPTGTNQMTLRLDGLLSRNEKVRTVDLWKLRKVSWKLEETIRTCAPACDKHAPAGATTTTTTTTTMDPESDHPPSNKPSRSVVRTETRVLGEKQMLEGWKSDYSGSDGVVDFEFDYAVTHFKTHARDPPRFACDMQTDGGGDDTGGGTHISHALQIELIVSKEFAPEGKPQLATQTGTGRILRMHFAVSMTEYPGLGVSWDNEAPPVYQDVPPSPPGYPSEPPIEYGQLEELDAQRQGTGSEPGSRRPSASGERAV